MTLILKYSQLLLSNPAVRPMLMVSFSCHASIIKHPPPVIMGIRRVDMISELKRFYASTYCVGICLVLSNKSLFTNKSKIVHDIQILYHFVLEVKRHLLLANFIHDHVCVMYTCTHINVSYLCIHVQTYHMYVYVTGNL